MLLIKVVIVFKVVNVGWTTNLKPENETNCFNLVVQSLHISVEECDLPRHSKNHTNDNNHQKMTLYMR